MGVECGGKKLLDVRFKKRNISTPFDLSIDDPRKI
jgi:hypothetical protein